MKGQAMINLNERLSRLAESIEEEYAKARWSLEKYESNPDRFAPQLDNVRHHLCTAARLTRSLKGTIATSQTPLNN